MMNLVREICERKRGKVHPELATALELKQELSRQGVHYTAESFAEMLRVLAEDPHIRTIRTINHNAYAYITKAAKEGIPTQEGGARTTNTCEYPILSEPAVAQSEKDLSRGASPVCGVSGEGGDNTSDDSGSHQTHQYWWSDI